MTTSTPPFSRIVTIGEVPATGRRIRITASAEECTAVARLLHLPSIASLEAEMTVTLLSRDGLAVSGQVKAQLTQTCALTAEDFDSDVIAPVEIRYSPDGRDPAAELDLSDLIDPEGEDPPDLMVGGRVDLGVVATEFLALSLDPYPRKPGAAFEEDPTEAGGHPFAALSALKKS